MKIIKLIAFVLGCSFLLGACAPDGMQAEAEMSGPVAIVDNNDVK